MLHIMMRVALFTRAWIEIFDYFFYCLVSNVALFTRAWIEISYVHCNSIKRKMSPSSRGRGLKSFFIPYGGSVKTVALFTRAWIEIVCFPHLSQRTAVALFTRAWIEISTNYNVDFAL